MKLHTITRHIKDLAPSQRILDTLSWYLFSLMATTDKHSQAVASKISGKADSLFSGLLARGPSEAGLLLNRFTKRRLKKILSKRKNIESGAPWKVAIIIDSTLHPRSSLHIENCQKFNHGKGYVIGHQWTNIGLYIAGEYIPIDIFPFYTQEECKQRKIQYKSEHQKIIEYLKLFSFKKYGIEIDPKEIVVLIDSGYDNKKIQNTIISRNWDFVVGLKADRQCSSGSRDWSRIDKYFEDGRRPWKSIRVASYRRKKSSRLHKIKQREGSLKGVHKKLKLVCSKRLRDVKVKHFASSSTAVSSKAILKIYRCRWAIEIFHREIKSHLGFMDAGVRHFDSLHCHVLLVLLAYSLLKENYHEKGIKRAQNLLMCDVQISVEKSKIQILSRIGGKDDLKNAIYLDIRRFESWKVA